MEVFIRRPSVDLFRGIRVSRETDIEYKTDNVKQTIRDLVFRNEVTVKGEGFDGNYVNNVYLSEGDVLIFESEERGYVKPLEGFVSVAEAMEDLANIKELG